MVYHISADGVARRCLASDPSDCRVKLGASIEHYDSKEEAQQAYEKARDKEVLHKLSKDPAKNTQRHYENISDDNNPVKKQQKRASERYENASDEEKARIDKAAARFKREKAEKGLLSDDTKSVTPLHVANVSRKKKAALNSPEKQEADRQSYKHNTLKGELNKIDMVDLFIDNSGKTLKKYDDLIAEMKQNIDEAKKSAHSSRDIAKMENDVVLHSLIQNVRHRNDLSELKAQKVNFPLFASQKRKKEILAEHERKIGEKTKLIEEQEQDNNKRVTENNLNSDLLEFGLRAKLNKVKMLSRS